MNRHRIAAIATSFAIVAGAVPAQAAVGHGSIGARMMPATPCSAPASTQCSAYQQKLLQIVQDKTLTGARRATMAELGRHQLDALIASID